MKAPCLIALILLCGLFSLPAAEIRDGHLYLSVNLQSASTIALESSGGALSITDASGLFEQKFNGKLRFSLPDAQSATYYRLLNPQPELGADSALRHYFSWENGKLLQKDEHLYFFPHSFEHLEAAENYALSLGQPFRNIMPLDISESGILIEDSSGAKVYLEAPLQLKSEGEILLAGFSYADEFQIDFKNGQLHLNQILALEEYIAGVLPNEIGAGSPLEALKAQAVAARTHAISLLVYMRHKAEGYDLCSATHCQVYRGKHLFNLQIEEAVMDTAGEIILSEERIADATYHSSCGGKTDASSQIWKGAAVAHLNGSICYPESAEYDLSTEKDAVRWLKLRLDDSGLSNWEKNALHWERSISRSAVADAVGLKNLKSVKVLQRGISGRITRLLFTGEKELILDSEYKIRQVFGNLPSSFFYIKGGEAGGNIKLNQSIIIVGRGSGHGVGMCQIGALRRARQGESYLEILENYYPETTISTDWMYHE